MARSHQYRNGLIHYAPDFACRGYTLFCRGAPSCAFLIDMRGRICKRWTHPPGIGYAQLLPSGHLLARASPSPDVQDAPQDFEWRARFNDQRFGIDKDTRQV